MPKLYWNEDSGIRLGGEQGEYSVDSDMYDANGIRWDRVTWCDTDAGLIETLDVDENGRYIISPEGEVSRTLHKTAAPLVIVKRNT